MKNFTKALICCCVTSTVLFLYKSFKDLEYTNAVKILGIIEDIVNNTNVTTFVMGEKVSSKDIVTTKRNLNLKYILQWTSPSNVPFVYMGQGQEGFINRNCSFTNCFVTSNRLYLDDYTKFDVIAFAGPEVRFMNKEGYSDRLPKKRAPHQKYAFASIESADNYPMCSNFLDGFFNWTWTYRLDSEAKWGYIALRDSKNNLIGPKTNMNWINVEDMEPVTDELKKKLRSKTKAAAWFVSNCYSRSERELFVLRLKIQLAKYDLKVDVYGECGAMKCPRDKEDECNKMIEKDYFFYLSFENSFAEDYVTEKLLHPLKNYAIPIVYGGANYTRFMPDGIYLNARQLGPKKLASKMYELIQEPDKYANFFKWRNHYSYHRRDESVETDDYCRFCSMLNEEKLIKTNSVYESFKDWWDPPHRC